jgi:hypothetical protein
MQELKAIRCKCCDRYSGSVATKKHQCKYCRSTKTVIAFEHEEPKVVMEWIKASNKGANQWKG